MSGPVSREQFFQDLGIGNTPLIDLTAPARRGRVFLKCEFDNPFGSAKDRTAAALVADALQRGRGNTLVESTSGNLGIALGGIHRHTGIPMRVVMSSDTPPEIMRAVRDLGVGIEMVRQPLPHQDLRESRSSMAKALGQLDGYTWLNQYGNDAAVDVHEYTTAPEIFEQAELAVDAVVGSVGTGGTLCGIARHVRAQALDTVTIGVEPNGSGIFGPGSGGYLPAGAGMKKPSHLMRTHGHLIDRAAHVSEPAAAWFALVAGDLLGRQVGLSAGLALATAVRYAEDHNATVVAIAPDTGLAFADYMRSIARPMDRLSARRAVNIGTNPMRASLEVSRPPLTLVRNFD